MPMKNLMNLYRKIAVQTLIIGLVAMGAQNLSAQTLRLHGTSLLKGIIDPHLNEITNSTGLHLELAGNGTDNGLLDLVSGKADVAMFSGPSVADVVQKINNKTANAVDLSTLKIIPVGTAKIAVIVNRANPVRKLTDQQVVGLFSGKITNWKEVGGNDQLVELVIMPDSNGLRLTMQNVLMKNETFNRGAFVAANGLIAKSRVAQLPRAIGFMGASLLSDSVAQVTLDTEIGVPVALVVKGQPTASVQNLANAIQRFVQ
jgi:phosphate transport system substrate-binding protein